MKNVALVAVSTEELKYAETVLPDVIGRVTDAFYQMVRTDDEAVNGVLEVCTALTIGYLAVRNLRVCCDRDGQEVFGAIGDLRDGVVRSEISPDLYRYVLETLGDMLTLNDGELARISGLDGAADWKKLMATLRNVCVIHAGMREARTN